MICEYQRKYESIRWKALRFLVCEFQESYCLLSGIGRGTEAELGPDKPEFGKKQHW